MKLIIQNLQLTKEQALREVNQAKEAYKRAESKLKEQKEKINRLEKEKAKYESERLKIDSKIYALKQDISETGGIAKEWEQEVKMFSDRIKKYENIYNKMI